jgi:hypothetical protein
MNTNTLRIVLAIFLIAHGLIHYSLTYVPVPKPGELRTPFWPSWARTDTDPTWLASRMGLSNDIVRGVGSALWLLTVAGFSVAGLGLLGIPGLNQIWQGSAILGASASLILLVFYWHPWLIAGVLINLAVFAGLALHWPKSLFS